jgi:hypothetical protein
MSIFSYGYIRNGHIGNDVIKCIGLQICPFPKCPFSEKPPFLPAPRETMELFYNPGTKTVKNRLKE